MLRKPKNKQKTVAEKVADLLIHPNESSEGDSSAGEDEAPPRIADFDVDEYAVPDARSTEFRKRNVKMLSEQSARYRGKVTSRKDIFEEEDVEEDEESEAEDASDDEDEADEEALAKFGDLLRNGHGKDTVEDDDQDEDDDDDDDEAALAKFGDLLRNAKNGISSGKRKSKPSDGDSEEATEGAVDDDSEEDDEAVLAKFGGSALDSSADEQPSEQEASEDDDDDDEDKDDEDDDDDDDDENNSSADEANETAIVTETNRQAELEKGLSVQNQLRIWEKLLELRIQSQACLNKANQLPAPEELRKSLADSADQQLQQVAKECTSNTAKLLTSMLQLQQSLQQQHSELQQAIKRARPAPAEPSENDDPSEGGPPPQKRFAGQLAQRFEAFRPYRDSVLLKWDDRTKLLTPGAAGKRHKSLQDEYNIVQKIENALINPSVLLERSQVPKLAAGGDVFVQQQRQSAARDVDDNPEEPFITPQQQNNRLAYIYDDSDFYHQQLRELIEHKANTSSSMSEVTRQYVELQKLRQKMKKQVDTRASKGRKLRYLVHKKLINFMAPMDLNTDWTEESRNELYKSLFSSVA